ncbi:EI24 domain-containing protein [Nevskia soli]|uniref:EI24 domain-containing protein n=1 Tax=Nevskia soli TaxID=418856 RepID=UPI0004A6DB27|nr:EI24 domain-containing protein [Nevskia soli]
MTDALAKALRDFFTPRMLGLVLWPLLGSVLLWSLLGYFFWHDLVNGLQHLASVPALKNLFGDTVLHVVSEFSVAVALFLILPPLVQATALLITATVAMPLMVEFVARRDYPQLERRRGGTIMGSVWNALGSTLAYLLLWLVTLPLWLFGLPAVVLPVLLNGWLNDRLFRYDALSEHASRDEYALLRGRAGGRFYLLGCVASLIQLVPVVNLVAPVYSGLCFIHFGCAALVRLRSSAAA